MKTRGNSPEAGFTLIELLVVVVIIGVLAGIALPTFLNQRNKAWDAAVKTDLRNASTAQETFFADNSAYAATRTALQGNDVGYNPTQAVLFAEIVVTGPRYCMTAYHESQPAVYWYLDSAAGSPTQSSVADPC